MRKVLFAVWFGITSFLTAQNWQPNFEQALEYAQIEGKPIILVFAGSDWCGPCMKLENEIWTSETFVAYSNDNYILYKADFPQKRKNQLPKDIALQNAILAEQYNPNGYFPFVVVLDNAANILGMFGYERKSPDAYIDKFNKVLR